MADLGRKRAGTMEASSVSLASQGISKRASRMQSRGWMGLVKFQRISKKKKNNYKKKKEKRKQRVSREQTGTNCAQGTYSQPANADLRPPADADLRPPCMPYRVSSPRFGEVVRRANLGHAKTALEFYEKSRQDDTEFEILQVVAVGGSRLKLPEDELDTYWMHMTFLAKPKIGDVSPTHFFAELFKDDSSGKFKATYCSTYEPSDAPGFNHGCVFCMPKNPHPVDGYLVGRPPWYRPKVRWGAPWHRPKGDGADVTRLKT